MPLNCTKIWWQFIYFLPSHIDSVPFSTGWRRLGKDPHHSAHAKNNRSSEFIRMNLLLLWVKVYWVKFTVPTLSSLWQRQYWNNSQGVQLLFLSTSMGCLRRLYHLLYPNVDFYTSFMILRCGWTGPYSMEYDAMKFNVPVMHKLIWRELNENIVFMVSNNGSCARWF